ncbi:MAG TPA: hypothetical protein VF605_19510 [Allosphingosinicella sp.]|jgi:hypothetical protein
MSLGEVLSQHPMLLYVIIPSAAGLGLFLVIFIIGCAKSGLGFWGYLAEIDMSYPIKPNSRLMYHKLAAVSDAHDTAQDRLSGVTEELKLINGKLERLAKEVPGEAITEVQQELEGVLNQLEKSNVTPFRRRQ